MKKVMKNMKVGSLVGLGAIVATASMVVLQLASAAATPSIAITNINGHASPFNFSCATNPLFNPITLSGNGAGSAPPGNISQYKVQIDWGDGNVQNNVTSTFTPSSGQGSFTFTFSGAHAYATTTAST